MDAESVVSSDDGLLSKAQDCFEPDIDLEESYDIDHELATVMTKQEVNNYDFWTDDEPLINCTSGSWSVETPSVQKGGIEIPINILEKETINQISFEWRYPCTSMRRASICTHNSR